MGLIEKEKSRTVSTVVSYGSSESGTDKAYLRMVDQDLEEVTLPVLEATEKHKSFILATWVKSHTPSLRVFFPGQENIGLADLIKEEAKSSETLWKDRTLIVTSPGDSFTIHAWICGEQGRLDYVYVPPELRRKGIASALIDFRCGRDYQYGRRWPFMEVPFNGKRNPYLLGRGV